MNGGGRDGEEARRLASVWTWRRSQHHGVDSILSNGGGRHAIGVLLPALINGAATVIITATRRHVAEYRHDNIMFARLRQRQMNNNR